MKEFDFVIDCHKPIPMPDFDYNGFWQAFTFAELQCDRECKDGDNSPIVELFQIAIKKYVADADNFARLSTTLNHKCWYWNDQANFDRSALYGYMWERVHSFALEHYKGKMLDTYLKITD